MPWFKLAVDSEVRGVNNRNRVWYSVRDVLIKRGVL